MTWRDKKTSALPVAARRKRSDRQPLPWIVALTAIGFIFRVFALGTQSYWIDEAFSINAALAILEHGIPLLDSGLLYSRAPLFHYPLAGLIGLFGLTEWSTRIISVLFGTAFIPLIYHFTRRIADHKVGLTAAILWTVFTLGIAWSRQARMYMMLTFLVYLALFFFVRFLQGKNKKDILYCALASAAAILTHKQGWALPLIFAAYLPFHYLPLLKHPRRILKLVKTNAPWLAALVVVGTMTIIWKRAFILGVLSTEADYLAQYLGYLKSEYFLLFYFALAAILILKRFRYAVLSLLIFGIPFYFVVFHQGTINLRYVFFILPIMIVFASQAIVFLFEQARKLPAGNLLGGAAIALIIFSLYSSGTITVMPQAEYHLEPDTPMPDFKAAYENVNPNDTIVASYAPMTLIYLGQKPDYAFDISLSGLARSRMSNKLNPKTEVYNNVTLIDLKTLQEINASIVIDELSMRRLPPDMNEYLNTLNVTFRKYDARNAHIVVLESS
ncbi:MAG: glycosyltransferase family 39 protein [Nanobdellota archaeon]